MSPSWDTLKTLRQGFPRVSGDEPLVAIRAEAEYGFSPRERG